MPNIISSDYIREQIGNIELGKNTSVKFEQMSIVYRPFPGIKLSGLSVSVPDKFNLDVDAISIYPDLPSIAQGEIRISRIRIKKPNAGLILEDRPDISWKKIISDLQTEYKGLLYGLNLQVTGGSLRLYKQNTRIHSITNIELDSRLFAHTRYNLGCESDIWEKLKLKGRGNINDLSFEQELKLKQFKPHKIDSSILPSNVKPNPGNSTINLKIKAKNKGLKEITGDIFASASLVTIHRDGSSQRVRNSQLHMRITGKDNKYSVNLKEFSAKDPSISLSGKIHYNSETSESRITLYGEDIDLAAVRSTSLNLFRDIPGIEPTFKVVEAGNISKLEMKSSGSSLKQALSNIKANAQMSRGKIHIPGIDMDLAKVRGDIKIRDKILTASNLQADFANSKATDGNFTLGLNADLQPFYLNMDFQGSLADLPGIMQKTVSKPSIVNTLDKFASIEGQAGGNLILRRKQEITDLKILAENIRLKAKYKPYDLPVRLSGREFYYSLQEIAASGMDIKWGRSGLTDIGTKVTLADSGSKFRVSTGKGKLDLAQLTPQVKDILDSASGDVAAKTRKYLQKMDKTKGELGLEKSGVSGYIARPGSWNYFLEGAINEFNCVYKDWESTVAIHKGGIDLNSTSLELDKWSTRILDANAQISAKVKDFSQWGKGNLNLKGKLGQDFLSRSFQEAGLQTKFLPVGPVKINQSSIEWDKDNTSRINADVKVANTTELAFNLEKKPQSIDLRHISIRDEHSRTEASVHINEDSVLSNFQGKLSSKTANNLFGESDIFSGEIQGDFHISLRKYPPRIKSASGKLYIQDFHTDYLNSLQIEQLRLETEQENLNILPSRFYWQDTLLETKGKIAVQEDFNVLDVDVFTENMSWRHIQTFMDQNDNSRDKNTSPFHTYLKGDINFSSNRFVYKDFVFSPFHTSISLDDKEKANITISETRVCSIPVSGDIQISRDRTRVDFTFRKKNLNIENSLSCFRAGEEKRLMTGELDILGKIYGSSANSENLKKSLKGDINLVARNGRIYRVTLLAKILAYLNTTEALFGNMPDLQQQGLAYNSIIMETYLENNKLKITKGLLDGKTVEMGYQGDIGIEDNELDLVFLVAPFKTLDRLIKMIPLLNVITDGTLVSIPLKVTGKATDPNIIPLSPEAVSAEIFGIMKRTLNLPLTIIQPFLPGENKSKEGKLQEIE